MHFRQMRKFKGLAALVGFQPPWTILNPETSSNRQISSRALTGGIFMWSWGFQRYRAKSPFCSLAEPSCVPNRFGALPPFLSVSIMGSVGSAGTYQHSPDFGSLMAAPTRRRITMRRLTRTSPISLWAFRTMGIKLSPHPLAPAAQWISKGQNRETGDFVKRRSQRT